MRSPRSSPAPRSLRAARRSTRLWRDLWFLLLVLLLGAGSLLAFSAIGTSLQQRGQTTTPAQNVQSPTSTVTTTTSPANVTVQAAQARLYPFPQTNVGLMQPAVDRQENVWVGEMYANRLARLDSRTGVVTTWKPPHGMNSLMSTAIDSKGEVWFVEQSANYIGRFDPAQQAFRIFPLPSIHGRPMGPQDLQFDATGQLWFTATIGGRIGRLDPTSGVIQTWPVPAPRAGMEPVPFSLTVTHDEQVWFGYIAGGAVGRFDPATNEFTLYHLADPQAQIFSLAHDTHGRIWFTEIVPGKLGMIDSATGHVTELAVPTVANHPAALYELVVVPNGDVWFVNNGAGALVRYTPKDSRYTFFQLSLSSSAPYGLALDQTGTLWFTTSGPTTNAVGKVPLT